MVKRLLLASLLGGVAATVAVVNARQAQTGQHRHAPTPRETFDRLPDSAFGNVPQQDLLDDRVYRQLKAEGWSRHEIEAIMNSALRDRQAVRNRGSYYEYAKEWLPFQRLGDWADSADTHMPDSAVFLTDLPRSQQDFYNTTWPEIEYTPADRLAGRRNPGYWRPAKPKPSSGRVIWAAVHPDDHDKIMFIGEGAGIWRTDDGRNWRNITDNIPERNWRTVSAHSAIPVDPDDWDHVFAFMNSGSATSVWETTDGGDTWRRIPGATHGTFKRGYCFRDARGKLKFIGAVKENWSAYPGRHQNRLLISEDTCRTWTNLKDQLITADGQDLRDDVPGLNGGKGTHGLWFQQVEFDPKDRNRIYIPTSRSILYFDDGAHSTTVNGKLRYNLKKLRMRVHGRTLDTPVLNEDDPYTFPVQANCAAHMVIDPENPDRMWYATGSRDNNYTALYFTENRGQDWITLYDRWRGIGSTRASDTGIFGNEVAWVWLGGFAVNLKDNRYIYGTSQSSMWSEADWQNGQDLVLNKFNWGGNMTAQHDDGNYYLVSNARHQADNHFMLSHKSGRVFRGCDGGLLIIDPTVNGHRWTNIGRNANQMCHYRVQCNEFGDQAMISNTQDIDVQTYRYGRWGIWHGYEGSNASINPYANTGYWSGSGGTQGVDDGAYNPNSWASVVTRADVVNSTFYLYNTNNPEGRKLSRWDDLGRGGKGLDAAMGGVPSINNWGLCRDKGRCTIYAMIGNRLRRSIDQGETFHDVMYNGVPAQFSGVMALDPDNSDVIYYGRKGHVVCVDLAAGRVSELPRQGLPNIDCSSLLLHEGTGDLYFCNNGGGVYYLQRGASEWRFWLKGYNTNVGSSHVINYTTQEMIQCDFGRGIYVADLERPADRYHRPGFGLKQLSDNGGIKTIGIDSYLTVPLYYNYAWTVNGQTVDNPHQYLTARLQPGDRVQLTLTLRESPDVSTTSAVYTVEATNGAAGRSTVLRAVSPQLSAGSTNISNISHSTALYSDGSGRVDAGFTDLFHDDWTVDLWVKPETDGCIVGNRQRDDHLGAKGWVLCIEGGTLKFKYAPRHRFHAPRYEQGDTEVLYTVDCGRVAAGSWQHMAVSHNRHGQICIYVNGRLVGQTDRKLQDASLNSSLPLSLFGDGIDRYPLRGCIDELKVWKRALSQDEIRAEMYSTNLAADTDLGMHYDFDNAALGDNRDAYSGYSLRPRTRAVTSSVKSPLPLRAKATAVATATASDSTRLGNILTVKTNRQQNIGLGAYAYDAEQWLADGGNLPARYYDVHGTAYLLHAFDPVDAAERADLTFKPGDSPYDCRLQYRLYWSEGTAEQPHWNAAGELTYDPATGNLLLSDAPFGQLLGKRLVVVAPKPALEGTIPRADNKGAYKVYSQANALLTLDVQTLQQLDEPLDSYEITSVNGLLIPQGTLDFKHGRASVQLRIDMNRLTERGQTLIDTLRGKHDDLMIPLTLSVTNCITRSDAGNSLTIDGGCAQVGTRNTYLGLDGKRSFTFMGWVRVDDTEWAQGSGNMQFFWFNSGWGFMTKAGVVRARYGRSEFSVDCKINPETQGRWIHLAYVVNDRSVTAYVNGRAAGGVTNASVPNFSATSGLWLGSPTGGFDYFKGAFDQLSVWNRPLSQAEIVDCMHRHVTLDSPGLVSYVTMDQTNAEGQPYDLVSGHAVALQGQGDNRQQSTVPYNPMTQTDGSDGPLVISAAAGKKLNAVVSAYTGQSLNCIDGANTDLVPLNREHYTVAYSAPGNVTGTDQLTLTYTHPTVRGGEAVKLGIRSLGAVAQPYTTFVEAADVTDGQARFALPYAQLAACAEMMLFVPRTDEQRSAAVAITVKAPHLLDNENRVMLRDNDSSIPVSVRLTAGQLHQPVAVYVKEQAYAAADVEVLDFSHSEVVNFNLTIDRQQLDSKALNPVTLSLPGIDGSETRLQVYLEPKVTLRLRNGATANSIVATAPVVDLDIEARLEQGWLDKPVELEYTGAPASSTSTGAGTLLASNPVNIGGLKHFGSALTEAVAGWNLVGNPFMANVNLTKSQNVSFDEEQLSKFVYSYDAATGNYRAYDMTRYDAAHTIKPFEAYFVKSKVPGASLTVSNVATEKAPTKKTQAHAWDDSYVQLQLLTDGQTADHASIYWQDSDDAYVPGQDAPKLWSVNPKANQFYVFGTRDSRPMGNQGDIALSISSVNQKYGYFPLGIRVGTPGQLEIRLDACSRDLNGEELYIIDSRTDTWTRLYPGAPGCVIDVAEPGLIDNRYYFYHDDPTITGVGNVAVDSCPYTVSTGVNSLTVNGLQGTATVSLYRPNGVQVLSQHTTDCTFTMTVEPGLYLVQIAENNREYTLKASVK